jgi:MFS family permease
MAERQLIGANRDFTLLWFGQAVSALGSTASLVTYPLLVLHLTGSPALVGAITAVGMLARLAAALPGGVLADRFDKRKLLLVCDLARFVVQGLLAVGVVGGWLPVWVVVVAIAVEGAFSSVFGAAEPAAIHQVVAGDQLPLALARNEARGAAAMLLGPPIGGALFGLDPALPFAFDAGTYLVSFVAIALIRSPMPPSLERAGGRVGRELVEGLAWVWRHAFVRLTLLLGAGLNLVSNAIVVLAIVISNQRGDSAATTGLLVTFAGIGTLVGALAAPWLVRRLRMRTILVANRLAWAVLVLGLLVASDPVFVGGLLAVMCLMGPTGSTAVATRQMALTPDSLQGRASSARGFLAGLAGPVGAGLIGVSYEQLGLVPSVAMLSCWLLAMAVIAGASRAIRVEG